MRIPKPAILFHHAIKTERAVWNAEKGFAAKGGQIMSTYGDWECFPTAAPRRATYTSTRIRPFLSIVNELKLPWDVRFADLGSGLGNIGFAAARCFKEVTLYELDGELLERSKEIGKEQKLDNIIYKHEDLVNADLSEKDVIFFFKPFRDNYIVLMQEVVERTRPGTIVIAYTAECEHPEIFSPRHFREIPTRISAVSSHAFGPRMSAYVRLKTQVTPPAL
jgi:SAM-dependent methyltransferase